MPWIPPFEAVGDDGWKDSDEPLCTALTLNGAPALDVFSDARGVFVVMSGNGSLIASPVGDEEEDAGVGQSDAAQPIVLPPTSFTNRTALWFNDGSGWKVRADKPDVIGDYRITGIPSGPLLIYEGSMLAEQIGFPPSACTLGIVNDKTIDCFDLDPVQSAVAVDAQHAYALTSGVRLLAYDGTTWHSNLEVAPFPASALWADSERVLAVGKAGTAMWYQAGVWTLDDPGTLQGFTSVWGEAHDDLWAGTSTGGVYHYDGTTWTDLGLLGGVTCDAQSPVVDIWGAEGKVYFITQSVLARWDGEKLETLSNWSCSLSGVRIMTGITGNGPDEIFLTLIDNERNGVDACGPAFVVRYDGEEFHRM